MTGRERLDRALGAIDAANAEDPNILLVRGEQRPKALGEAELATEWVRRLRPEASEELLLAVRAHHLRRWTSPRASYPEGRAGYLRWRRDLHELHAAALAPILESAGYEADAIARVQDIVRKKDLAHDEEVKAFEDALCLVFLETQFADLAGRTPDETMVEVVRKTLAKMTDAGRQRALELDLGDAEASLVERALAAPTRRGRG